MYIHVYIYIYTCIYIYIHICMYIPHIHVTACYQTLSLLLLYYYYYFTTTTLLLHSMLPNTLPLTIPLHPIYYSLFFKFYYHYFTTTTLLLSPASSVCSQNRQPLLYLHRQPSGHGFFPARGAFPPPPPLSCSSKRGPLRQQKSLYNSQRDLSQ